MEVVGVRLHRQTVHTHDQPLFAGLHAVPCHLQNLVCHEVLAGTDGLHDGLDQVLRHVPVVHYQLLGVLGQAVAAVAEAESDKEASESATVLLNVTVILSKLKRNLLQRNRSDR